MPTYDFTLRSYWQDYDNLGVDRLSDEDRAVHRHLFFAGAAALLHLVDRARQANGPGLIPTMKTVEAECLEEADAFYERLRSDDNGARKGGG